MSNSSWANTFLNDLELDIFSVRLCSDFIKRQQTEQQIICYTFKVLVLTGVLTIVIQLGEKS